MIIVGKALERRHRDGIPVRMGLVSAGYMGRAITLQIQQSMVGMDVVAISNRTMFEAEPAYREAGVGDAEHVTSQENLERARSRAPGVHGRSGAAVPCCGHRRHR